MDTLRALFVCICVLLIHSIPMGAQTSTVYRKIAQRQDEYMGNTWVGKDSTLFSYNVDAMLTATHSLKVDAAQNWTSDYRFVYSLSPSGKVVEQRRENWNGSSWINANRYTYLYNMIDSLITIEYDVWNGTQWTPNGRITYTGFNAFGQWSEELTSFYIAGMWQPYFRKTQTYVNNQTKLQQQNKESYDVTTNSWKKIERLTYTYAQDSVSSITRSVPDSNQNWRSDKKYIYQYTFSPTRLNLYLVQNFDTITYNFVDESRVVYTYSNSNKLLSTHTEIALAPNVWVSKGRETYLYNALDECEEYTDEEVLNGVWTNKKKSNYVYLSSLLTHQTDYVGSASNWMPSTYMFMNYDNAGNMVFKQTDVFSGNNPVPSHRAFYYYQSYVVSAEDLLLHTDILIYPNPARNQVSVELSMPSHRRVVEILLYDMQGKVCQSIIQASQATLQVPVNTLETGVYFLAVRDASDGTLLNVSKLLIQD